MYATTLSRLKLFDIFLPHSALEKLFSYINRNLTVDTQKTTGTSEFRGIVNIHILSAAYNTSFSAMTFKVNKPSFFQTVFSGDEYNQIWSVII